MPVAGQLDRRITIERKSITQDDFGQEIETWATLATVWAGRRDLRGSEKFAAQQEMSQAETVFTVRYSTTTAAISVEDRIVDEEGLYYDITSKPVELPGRRQWLELYATTRAE